MSEKDIEFESGKDFNLLWEIMDNNKMRIIFFPEGRINTIIKIKKIK